MKNTRIFYVLIAGIVVANTLIAASDVCRVVLANGSIWTLSESTFEVGDGGALYDVIGDPAGVVSIDRGGTGCGGDGRLGVEIVRNGAHQVLVVDLCNGVITERFTGAKAGFSFDTEHVGVLMLNPSTAADAFYDIDLRTRTTTLVASGGFQEQFPIVASGGKFYVFRSQTNETLRVDTKTGVSDTPEFLKGRLVLAVFDAGGLFLVQDRISRETKIVTDANTIVSVLKLRSGDQALEFSHNGRLVYVSLFRTAGGAEMRDLAAIDIDSGNVTLIKKNFTVGVGQFSRLHGE